MTENYKYVKDEWVKFVKEHYLDYEREEMKSELMIRFNICKSYADRAVTLAKVYPGREANRRGPHRKAQVAKEGAGLRQRLIEMDERRWEIEMLEKKAKRETFNFDDSRLFRR